MTRQAPEPFSQRSDAPRKIGLMLINLGTPDAPTPQAVRRYLAEFLSDPRVVEIPPLVWKPILYGLILPFRPRASAAKYAVVWRDDGSPLRIYTQRQAQLLQGLLGERLRRPLMVRYAMRYGAPAIGEVLRELQAAGCERILALPLYPQYAASTTATALDQLYGYCSDQRDMPEVRAVKQFHDHPAYIEVLADSIRRHWRENGRADRLVMSFHGIPRRAVDRGDPYRDQCETTGRLLAQALDLDEDQWIVSFQSRFGRAEWLTPYTADTLQALGRQGVGRVDVICPGFVADCLETLEEIAIEGKQIFLGAGGKAFHVIPCLNDHPAWIETLATIAMENLGGWLPGQAAAPGANP